MTEKPAASAVSVLESSVAPERLQTTDPFRLAEIAGDASSTSLTLSAPLVLNVAAPSPSLNPPLSSSTVRTGGSLTAVTVAPSVTVSLA